MKTQSFCLRESQIEAIEQFEREAKVSEDMPDLSKSGVVRKIFDKGLEHTEGVEDFVSKSTRVKLREERYMKEEGDLINKRTGFETQVKRHFKKRFENGFRPAQLEDWAENMRAKARSYWPPDFDEDNAERRKEALAYVEALLEHAKQASDASDYDPLDPSEVFGNYSGVEDGRAKESDFDAVVASAEQRMQNQQQISRKALITALSNEYDVSEGVAKEAIEEAGTMTADTDAVDNETIDPAALARHRANELVEQGVTSISKISKALSQNFAVDHNEATQIAGKAVNRANESTYSPISNAQETANVDLDGSVATDGGDDNHV